MAKKQAEPIVEKVLTSEDQIEIFLKTHKDDHYNYEETISYRVSSGSLILDLKTGGGIGPGICRFTGISEGGKTSCALAYARNFQLTVKNSKVVYIKAEGRLEKEVLIRAGIDTSKEKWFVFESNVYEAAIDLMRDLVFNNPTDKKYFFIIDSVDGLIPKKDKDKGTEEATKVAGGAVLGTDFLRRMSLAMGKRGHIVIMMSQVRAQVSIDPYAKKEHRLTQSSGGNAMNHYPNWIFEFQPRFKDDLFFEGTKLIGHQCKIIFRKSINESSQQSIQYPIRYGRTNGRSVWIEREIIDILMAFDQLKKAGSWLSVDPELLKECESIDTEIPEKLQGQDQWKDYLESSPNIREFLFSKCYKIVMGTENASNGT